ncbi:hypothetical protein GA0115249_120127 [Streptomyces sp. PpalLS-921]|nr:hypothetical protein GA0115249_120127 [Streptomyces sp. PpalLS-921]
MVPDGWTTRVCWWPASRPETSPDGGAPTGRQVRRGGGGRQIWAPPLSEHAPGQGSFNLLTKVLDLAVSGELAGQAVHLTKTVPGPVRGGLPHRHQGEPRVAVGLFGVVGDEAGRGERDVVEDLGPLATVLPQIERLLGVPLGGSGGGRVMFRQGAEGERLHAVHVRLVEHLHPARRRHVPLVGDEELLGLAEGAPHGLPAPQRGLGPCLDGVQHGLGARQGLLPRAGLGQFHEIQCFVGASQMDHLTGRPGQRLTGARPVAALARRVGGDDEVLLGGRFEADVVGHPSREYGEVGGDAPQAALEVFGVAVGEHAAHLVELAHNCLALESAAAGGVPGPEHLHGALQGLDLLGPDRCGLVPVEAGVLRVEGAVGPGRPGGRGGIGVQPVVHGAGDG